MRNCDEREKRLRERMKQLGSHFNKVKFFQRHMDFENENEEICNTSNPQELAMKHWRMISSLILNGRNEDFKTWIKEINPEVYEINKNKSRDEIKQSPYFKKASSKSIGMSEADSDSENNKKSKKKLLKKMTSFKLIVQKVLVKSVFKHVTKIEEELKNKDLKSPDNLELPHQKKGRRPSVRKSGSSKSKASNKTVRKLSTNEDKPKVQNKRRNAQFARMFSEDTRYLNVPRHNFFDLQDFKRKNSSDCYFSSITSKSNSVSKNKSSKKSSIGLPKINHVINPSLAKINLRNIKPLKLSTNKVRQMCSFRSEEERSLDELKTKLLLAHRSMNREKRRRLRHERNLAKSVDFLPSINKFQRIPSNNFSNFSRKSTGFTKSTQKKKCKYRGRNHHSHLSKKNKMFLSQQATSQTRMDSLSNFSEEKLKRMQTGFEEITNQSPSQQESLPVINFKHVPNLFNSPRVRFSERVLKYDPDSSFLDIPNEQIEDEL